MKRYYKHIAVIFILLVLFAGLLTNCMLNNIKDTDSILHDDYSYLSLVDGAIAWETGVIRRMYDFGQIFPVYKLDNRDRKIIQGYVHPERTDQMVRLIHAFFYRVPGSTGETDFGATMQLASNDPLVVVQTIAKVIALCQNIQVNDQAFQKAVHALATHKNLQGLAPKVINNPLVMSGKNRPVWRIFIDQAYAKKNQPGYEAHVANVQIITQFCENLAVIQNLLHGLLKFQALLGTQMAHVMLGALRESDPQNPDALYPPHTVEMIFLSFVYKKYSYNRTMLKAFYDALNLQFGSKILVRDLDEQWVKDSFAPITQAQALRINENIFAEQGLQSITQHFAEFVYNAFQVRSFPAPVGYENAVYEYEKEKKTEPVADCMDNTMRNFINIYAYDAQQNSFTLERLLANMRITVVDATLADFLKVFGEVNMASSLEAHNAWLQVISHIPYVAYNQMVDGSTRQSTKALETGKGYIGVPEKDQTDELLAWLKVDGYQMLEKNQYGYELQPSLKNIIIVLNQLLALNLFSQAGGLAKEFMRPDFIKEYFSKLCVAVKATGFLSTEYHAKQGESDKDFDVLDYKRSIYTTIDIAKIICKFTTSSGHGELALYGVLTHKEPFSFLKKINKFPGQPSLSLLVTNLLCKQEISFNRLENNPEYLYINLFATPLDNTGRLSEIVSALSYNIIIIMPSIIKINSMELLLRLADRQPDESVGQEIKLKICKSFLDHMSEDDLIGNPHLTYEIEKTALRGSVNSWCDGGLLLESLIKKGQSFAVTAQYAEKLLQSDEYYIRNFASRLFDTLFSKNQGYKEAIRAAEQGMSKGKTGDAISLFKTLFEKGLGFQEAIQAAEKAMSDEKSSIGGSAIAIFVLLFEKGLGLQEAIRAAQKEVESKDPLRRSLALKLFTMLVKKDHAFKEASQATQYIDFSGKDEFKDAYSEASASSDLFEALVSKNQSLVEAMEFATKSFVLNNYISFSLLELLITKAPEETKKAMQKVLRDPSANLSNDAKRRLRELLK